MTNAIEQTRRDMYKALASMKGRIEINYSIKDMQRGADDFEHSLEDHLEELRKAAHESFNAVAAANTELAERCIALTEERDTLRNKLQALQMASSTAAEVIRGLRSELEEAREKSFNPAPMHSIQIDCAKGIHLLVKHESTGGSTCLGCGVRK